MAPETALRLQEARRLEREETAWYPNMRLFGQRRFDDWEDVVARIADSINALIRSRRGTC